MVGIGLVGFGYWGPNLARNFSSQANGRLVAICEQVPQRMEKAARMYPSARVTADYAELLSDPGIQAILVATPVSGHYELTKRALLAGKDVFVEKPFTQTVQQAEELIELARARNLLLAVDHTFLFTGAVQKIKELVDSKALGDLLYFDSVRVNLGLFQEDVNVIHDLAPHDLSILYHLLGKNPVAVRAMGSGLVKKAQASLAYLHLEYDDGFIAHFHFSWLAPVKIRKTILAGTQKMLVYDDLDQAEKVKVYDKGVVLQDLDDDSLRKIKIDYRTGDMLAPKISHHEALNVEAQHFIRCVEERTRPLADGEHGLKVVQALEAAALSLEQGGRRILLEGA